MFVRSIFFSGGVAMKLNMSLVQPVKEFRPPMSEIVDSLVSFSQKLVSKSGAADGTELDPLERSFRTTTSRFIGSPALSYVSA